MAKVKRTKRQTMSYKTLHGKIRKDGIIIYIVDIEFSAHVSGIAFIGYAHSNKIGEPNDLNDFGSKQQITRIPQTTRVNSGAPVVRYLA